MAYAYAKVDRLSRASHNSGICQGKPYHSVGLHSMSESFGVRFNKVHLFGPKKSEPRELDDKSLKLLHLGTSKAYRYCSSISSPQ